MKKLISPVANGGFPWTNEDFTNIQETESVEVGQLYESIGSTYVVTGCGLISQDATASTCEITGGWIWIGGALRYLEEYAGTYPFYVIPGADVVENRTFQDATVHPAYRDRTVTTTTTLPTSGPFLTFSPTCSLTLLETITGLLVADVTALKDGKQNRVTTRIVWTALPLTTGVTPYPVGNGYSPEYCRTEDGFVHLRGDIEIASAGFNLGTIAQLPASVAPAKSAIFNKRTFGGNNIDINLNATSVGSPGIITTGTAASGTIQLCLSGISYYPAA